MRHFYVESCDRPIINKRSAAIISPGVSDLVGPQMMIQGDQTAQPHPWLTKKLIPQLTAAVEERLTIQAKPVKCMMSQE